MATKAKSAGAKKAEDTDSSKRTADKKKSLSEEAHSAVGAESSAIVEHLMERAKRGDRKSAQVLVELAKREAEAKEAALHGPLRSQALSWAAEPQWEDELNEEKAETRSISEEAEQGK